MLPFTSKQIKIIIIKQTRQRPCRGRSPLLEDTKFLSVATMKERGPRRRPRGLRGFQRAQRTSEVEEKAQKGLDRASGGPGELKNWTYVGI